MAKERVKASTQGRERFGKGERKSTPQGCIATKMKERERWPKKKREIQ